jgi:phage terminase large subunit GpA-like protein
MSHVLDSTLRYLRPRERTRTLLWCLEHARNVDGRPFDHDMYPHLGAPGGPADALDDPSVRRIWLQFASRLGKTFLGQSATLKKADCNPGPMMFASSVEKTAGEVIERTYKMIEQSPRVAHQLRPEARRRQTVLDFEACQCFIAWSRSVSTLADKEVEFGHANEIDKWEQASTSKEADPLKLFLDRFKNRPHHKVILESTPAVRGQSRVEAGRLASSNCSYFVPCPECGRYQKLAFDRIVWEKDAAGRSDRDLARSTARYACEHCDARLEDHHRPLMMRHGVWVPEGCKPIDSAAREAAERWPLAETQDAWHGWASAPWIEGKPLRNGPDAGYQLASYYALTLGWGDLAAEWVSCQGKPQDLRNFVNSWKAETWETRKREADWELLSKRVISHRWTHGEIPHEFLIVTSGVDRQDTCFKYAIEAWGPGQRSHTVDYGIADNEEDLIKALTVSLFGAEGPFGVKLALIDSGFRPRGIHDLCKALNAAGVAALPCKGANAPLNTAYAVRKLGAGTAAPGARHVLVDTLTTQDWIERQLYDLASGDDGGMSIYHAAPEEHQEFLEELLNEGPEISEDGKRESWDRLDRTVPNDFRDCRRYAFAAMLLVTKGKPIIARGSRPQTPRSFPGKKNASAPFGRAGGWLDIPR